jgi:hypothetical protein
VGKEIRQWKLIFFHLLLPLRVWHGTEFDALIIEPDAAKPPELWGRSYYGITAWDAAFTVKN